MNIKKRLRHIIRKCGYEISKVGACDLLNSLIYQKYHDSFFFVQIGANDGKRFDPLYDSITSLDLQGIAVEPVRTYYDDLCATHEKTRVTPINKAIYSANQKVVIYRVAENHDTPEWRKGAASLDPDHYKRSDIPESIMEQEIVDGITFDTLFTSFNVTSLDLLVLDTEGYDYNLIKLFPFDKFKPSIIQFEHGLPDQIMSFEKITELTGLLLAHGYNVVIKDYDCIAYR